MRTHRPICACIIAQAIEAQRIKKSFAAIMQVYYAGSRDQSLHSSTTFRTTRLPPPDTWYGLALRVGIMIVAVALCALESEPLWNLGSTEQPGRDKA